MPFCKKNLKLDFKFKSSPHKNFIFDKCEKIKIEFEYTETTMKAILGQIIINSKILTILLECCIICHQISKIIISSDLKSQEKTIRNRLKFTPCRGLLFQSSGSLRFFTVFQMNYANYMLIRFYC